MANTSVDREDYRQLFDLHPGPTWVYDPESLRILAVNDAAVERYGYSREEFLELRISDLRPGEEVPALLDDVAKPAASRSRSGPWRHRTKGGRELLVEITSRAVCFAGRAARLVLATDITQREADALTLRLSHERYERQYDALVSLTRSGILQRSDETPALREITETTARTLQVERVSIWRFTPGRDGIVAHDLFLASTDEHTSGHLLEITAYPGYFRALAGNDVIAADEARSDPRTREFTASYLEPYGIASMLDAPILVGGQLEGVVCLEHVGSPRVWSAAERSFAMSVANLVSLMLAQRAVAASEARLRTIVDSEPECVKVVDLEGRFIDINPAGLRMVGAERADEVLGQPVVALIHPDDRAAYRLHHARVSEGETGLLQFRLTGLRGDLRWVETHSAPLRDAAGAILSVLSVTRDFTDRRRAEQEVSLAAERFRLVTRATSDAIWDWDPVTDELWWSDGFKTLFGLDRAGLAANREAWRRRIHPDDSQRVTEEVERTVASGRERWSTEYRFRRGEGTYAHVLDRGYVIRDAAGNALRMIGGLTDISERKALERQLLESQKLESVGRLAGGIAHDFNNLLTVILGTIDLDLGTVPESDPLHADLRVVREAAERAARLTGQLLTFSRRQTWQPRVLDLNQTIGELLAMLRRLIGEHIEVRFQPDPGLGNVRADPGGLEQMLVNLVVNARDAMPAGGILAIETENVVLDEGFVAIHPAARPGPHVRLAVSDTGIGMDAATRTHVFEPFFTTKGVGQGTGLGLATVYGIVQQSGGSIAVTSEPAAGATFEIFLPRIDEAAVDEVKGELDGDLRGTETLLVVEDEAPLRRLAERVLRTAGYTVLAAADGEEALAALERHRGEVDLLVTDVIMPGMSGPDLVRRVGERFPQTRALYVSGYTDDALVHHRLPAGAAALLRKPFTSLELARAVRRALNGG